MIRRIDQNRNVRTFAGQYGNASDIDGVGTDASFATVFQMCFDPSGNLILACGTSVRAATNVTTLAGSFTGSGYNNGSGSVARFSGARGVCASLGTVYVADATNYRVRSITSNAAPQPVSPANLQLSMYPGLRIVGTVGRTYQIQASPDMNTWNTVVTLLLSSSPYLWIDSDPIASNRFYRALLLP